MRRDMAAAIAAVTAVGLAAAGSAQAAVPTTNFTLTAGMNGVKVYLVQQHLHIAYGATSTTMGSKTIAAVKTFQKSHHLPQTGNVDKATFDAMKTGYPFTVDAWKAPNVAKSTSAAARVTAMVNFAHAQIGARYVWGGTGNSVNGRAGLGYDCAGLALQAVRSGGRDPQAAGNYYDIYTASDLSNVMKTKAGFAPVSTKLVGSNLTGVRAGDLVFWGYGGKVHHVAIAEGGGKYVQAIQSGVVETTGDIAGAEKRNGYGSSQIMAVQRPFS